MLIIFALIIVGLISVFGWWLIPLVILSCICESSNDSANVKARMEADEEARKEYNVANRKSKSSYNPAWD